MPSLTFYGGVGEIGGNKILLEDGDTKIFLDFGMNFTRYGKYYAEFLQPRTCNGIGDLLEFGIIPDIDNIYRNDLLENEGRKLTEEPMVDGVIVSHSHADHVWHISLLHKDIPIVIVYLFEANFEKIEKHISKFLIIARMGLQNIIKNLQEQNKKKNLKKKIKN